MSTPAAVPAVAEPPAPMSFPARFVGVFFSPRQTFADIARQPNFIAPLIVSILSAVVFTEAMLAKIGAERIMRNMLEQNPRASSMSAEQMQQAIQQGGRFVGIFSRVQELLGAPIGLLIMAGIGLLIVNVVFGARVNFKTAFSVAAYGSLPMILSLLMGLALILFGDPEHFNVQNPVPSNPGFFMNPLENSKALVGLLSALDIFPLWIMSLLGIGFSEATEEKVRTLPIFFCFFGLWLVIWVLGIKTGLAMLG